MKILLALPLGYNNIESELFIEMFRREGVEFEVLSYGGKARELSKKFGFKLHEFVCPLIKLPWYLFGSKEKEFLKKQDNFIVKSKLKKKLEKIKPDVIIVHPTSYFFVLSSIAKNIHKISFSVGQEIINMKQGPRETRLKCKKLISEYDFFMANHFVANWLVLQGLDKDKIVPTYWPPVDTDFFSPENIDKELIEKYKSDEKKNIIMFRRVRAEAIDAALAVLKSIAILKKKTDKFNFIIGGLFDENHPEHGKYKTQIKNKAKELDVLDSIRFLPQVDKKDLPKYLNLGDIYIDPGFFTNIPLHGLGSISGEAMSCKLPYIGHDFGNKYLQVKNGKNGYMCNIENREDMANKLFKLIEDDKLLKKMSDSARETMLELNSYASIVKTFKKLILKVKNQ
jgi:glycosyltransferase involved in cell wall biosynthesis